MKKISVLCLVLVVIVLGWFSFVKPYDHKISFEVNVPAGTMYDIISDQNTWKTFDKQPELLSKEVFKSLQQEMKINEEPFKLLWSFDHESLSKATVSLKFLNKNHSLRERYLSFFKSSSNLDTLVSISKELKKRAHTFSKRFKIEIDGIDTLAKTHYLFVSEHTQRHQKASTMIKNNTRLFMKNRDSLVTKSGNTFVTIEDWNLETDSIRLRYAFPVKPQSTYPTDEEVKADVLPEQKVLKATFYGNYSLTDQAWIAMYHYAQSYDLNLELTPIEIFYNNPMLGGDDKNWKAEIFMPIKN